MTTRRMVTIRERLVEDVANTLGGQVIYSDDDDIVHAIEQAARRHPAVWRWWQTRIRSRLHVEQDVKAVRQIASEGGSRAHD